jgi:hypothetical protein
MGPVFPSGTSMQSGRKIVKRFSIPITDCNSSKFDALAKTRKTPLSVIPAE